MASPRSVDDYIATRPPGVRGVLRRVRGIIRKAVPGAEEAISYGIPTYKVDGRAVIYFAGWKEHFSLYPATATVKEALGGALAGYAMSKGTIRFPLDRPVPATLIARIARLRARESRERGKRT
jgi:uncharacterized protein YdhG (YjbR/CyaY superfamily)